MRISDWSSDVCSSDLADPRPSLVACNTTIGYGAPNKAGSHNVHGSPLGADEIAAPREHLEWPHEAFLIPDEDIGRASCRERLCQYVLISVVPDSLKKTNIATINTAYA